MKKLIDKNNHRNYSLVHRASRDGFEATKVRQAVLNKNGILIMFIKANQNIFGSYTTIPWKWDSTYRLDERAFLFSLTNKITLPII